MKEKIKSSTVHLLDDDKKCRKLDPAGIIHLTSAFPEQCRIAASLGARFVAENSLPGRPIDGVILAGMGGSAIGGDLLHALMTKYGKVPFSVSRSYELPAWATRNTLVLAASCSGDTEETLAAYDAARAKGAMVVCVTSGGSRQLKGTAPFFPFSHAVTPTHARGAGCGRRGGPVRRDVRQVRKHPWGDVHVDKALFCVWGDTCCTRL